MRRANGAEGGRRARLKAHGWLFEASVLIPGCLTPALHVVQNQPFALYVALSHFDSNCSLEAEINSSAVLAQDIFTLHALPCSLAFPFLTSCAHTQPSSLVVRFERPVRIPQIVVLCFVLAGFMANTWNSIFAKHPSCMHTPCYHITHSSQWQIHV